MVRALLLHEVKQQVKQQQVQQQVHHCCTLLPLAAPELHCTAACCACITASLLHLLPLPALHTTAASSACMTAALYCRLQRLNVRALLLHSLPYLVLYLVLYLLLYLLFYLVVRYTLREPTAA